GAPPSPPSPPRSRRYRRPSGAGSSACSRAWPTPSKMCSLVRSACRRRGGARRTRALRGWARDHQVAVHQRGPALVVETRVGPDRLLDAGLCVLDVAGLLEEPSPGLAAQLVDLGEVVQVDPL